jgi:hypothetical protein
VTSKPRGRARSQTIIELGYDAQLRIDSISIYETLNPGAVDRVSVRDPSTELWTIVWTGTAAPVGNASRIFTVTFPLTSFPVDGVRIDLNSPAVQGWNEIDAVGISGPGPLVMMTETHFGSRLFQALVPVRAQMAATYTNGGGSTMTVGTNAVLFDGFKDLVLLFNQLSRYGNNAAELGRLLFARGDTGDLDRAKQVAGESAGIRSGFPDALGTHQQWWIEFLRFVRRVREPAESRFLHYANRDRHGGLSARACQLQPIPRL